MAEKIDGMSLDIEALNKEKLRAVFPECFTEDRLEIDKLLALCGEYISDDFEKYEFKWKGKSECLRLAHKRSTATLRPVPEDSVNWNETKNIYIEGDNLEVLKLLQKSYFRKVKMIYIDPPYNTGNDFVYQDSFAEPLARYKEVTQQTTKSNPETMGRYHTNWLNMMYPRLRLAANLLRDDGVIFISIDDNEMANLRKVCDEVFGEENFVAQIVWQKKYAVSNDDPGIAAMHEYIVVYQKSADFERNLLPRTDKQLERYKNLDDDPRGVWSSDNYISNKSRWERPTLWYSIIHPRTGKTVWPDENAVWRYSKEKHAQMVAENRLYWGSDQSYERPRIKRFLNEIQDGIVPPTWWPFTDVGHNDEAVKETAALLGKKVFSTPKPLRLLIRILGLATNKSNNDIVLDFFSGSSATAHAVMQLNAEDGGNRQFICVQLPELCDEKGEAYKSGYKNICEIGKERIRRAREKILESDDGKKPRLDVGFKVFRLDSSNMKLWDDTPIEGIHMGKLIERMDHAIDNLKPGRSEMDLVYEILLKMGSPLTAELVALDISGLTVYSAENHSLLICLQCGITAAHIEQMAAYAPKKIVLAENALADNSAMSNAHYLLKNKNIELKIV